MIAGKPLRAWLDRADELGAQGRWFDVHEELEIPWKAAAGEEKTLLQGLIQIAAGLHRLRLHPEKTGGAYYLLERGREKLSGTKNLMPPDAFPSLDAALKNVPAA
ncbi:MAG: DUF309 domain-containing protein [Elusimicrobiota bacterium]